MRTLKEYLKYSVLTPKAQAGGAAQTQAHTLHHTLLPFELYDVNILSLLIQKPHSLQMILQSRIISLTQICSCKCADCSLSILGWGLRALGHVLRRAEWTGSFPQHSLSQE